VHALEEIRRVLIPGGLLIDLRPLVDRWPVEVVWRGGKCVNGRLIDLPTGLADDAAANSALEEVTHQEWFTCENVKHFQIFVYWNDPEEMRLHILERWNDTTVLGDAVLKETITTWSAAGENKRVRVKMRMLLSVLKKP